MDDKVTFKELFQVNLKYLEYLLEKSYISHQYFHNISLTGEQIECEFRKILSGLLPARYKVTYGYIASATSKNKAPAISRQLDVIIVDTLVPHSIYILEDRGMEVVPVESVVAIFEVKRTLTPEVLDKALEHLYATQLDLGITKLDSQTYFPGGVPGIGVMYSNPLLGILSLDHEKFSTEEEYGDKYGNIIKKRVESGTMPDLDIWASLGSSLIMATQKDADPRMYWAYTCREPGKTYPYLFKVKLNSDLSQAYFLSISLGFILYYLSNITGRTPNLENYFFNDSI